MGQKKDLFKNASVNVQIRYEVIFCELPEVVMRRNTIQFTSEAVCLAAKGKELPHRIIKFCYYRICTFTAGAERLWQDDDYRYAQWAESTYERRGQEEA
jgi:hypothetical protein